MDTSWCTAAYDSIFIRPGTLTVPGTHTRPRSFLSKSTIIKFSARSLTDVASFEASATSASHPKGWTRGAVPLMGLASRTPPAERRRNRSGEEQHTATTSARGSDETADETSDETSGAPPKSQPPKHRKAAYGAGLVLRSTEYSVAGSGARGAGIDPPTSPSPPAPSESSPTVLRSSFVRHTSYVSPRSMARWHADTSPTYSSRSRRNVNPPSYA